MTPDELKAWRTRRGLSQAELAVFLGVDPMTVSRWERGERGIPSFLHLALKAYKVPPVTWRRIGGRGEQAS